MGKGRAPCCEKIGLNRGSWTPEEDLRLIAYIHKYGHDNWRALPKLAGLLRCGKSCRLRWINYLRPDIKRGNFTKEEEETIIKLHSFLGNKWSKIASCLPGRTDNEIKNVWNTYLKKRIQPDHHDQQLDDQMEGAEDNSCSSSSCTSLITGSDHKVENKSNNSTTNNEEEQTDPISSLETALMEIIPIDQSMDMIMWNLIDQDHEEQNMTAPVPFSSSSSSSSSSSEIFFKMDQDQNGAINNEDPSLMMNNMADLLMLELPYLEDLSIFYNKNSSISISNDLHYSSKEWMENLEEELLGLGDHEFLHDHESLNSWVDMVEEDPALD